MKIKILYLLLIGVVLTACASPTAALPTPTQLVPATPASISAATLALTSTSAPNPSNICTDPQVTALIDSLKTSVLSSDGALLASLVSPTSGMDVRYIRYGTVVNYQLSQAKFLFETTFEVDWGAQPGSGEAKVGAFHDVIVPDLQKVFNQTYTLHCNELKHGGASYDVSWPYDKDFYSIYFPGTAANGNLDWHTWVAGIEYVNGKPYLYALTQFFWEP
ncbi:MAG: hypothetical protein ACXW32_17725 [Limisphaerales bacterium]